LPGAKSCAKSHVANPIRCGGKTKQHLLLAVAELVANAGHLREVDDGHGLVQRARGAGARGGEVASRLVREDTAVAYAPVGAATLRPVIDRAAVAEAGRSLVTVAFQALASMSPADDGALPQVAAETVAGLASCALGNIKRALRCEGR